MKCKYCKKTIWFWQSWVIPNDTLETDIVPDYAVLMVPDYDTFAHESCSFFRNNKDQTQ